MERRFLPIDAVAGTATASFDTTDGHDTGKEEDTVNIELQASQMYTLENVTIYSLISQHVLLWRDQKEQYRIALCRYTTKQEFSEWYGCTWVVGIQKGFALQGFALHGEGAGRGGCWGKKHKGEMLKTSRTQQHSKQDAISRHNALSLLQERVSLVDFNALIGENVVDYWDCF